MTAPPSVLDDDIVRALTAAQGSTPLPAARAARLRHRVLARVAGAESGHLTVPAAGGAWQAFGRGVEIKVLHEADGLMSYLLRLAPGAVVAAHHHAHDEECVVLQGTLRIGEDVVVGAGGFHLARRGSLHAAISAPDGATIYLRGAVPHPADEV